MIMIAGCIIIIIIIRLQIWVKFALFSKYVFTHPFHHRQDVTQGQFLNRVWLVAIQIFSSPKMVTVPRLKSPISTTISLWV